MSGVFLMKSMKILWIVSGLVLLCFLFRRQIFCYDNVTSQPLQQQSAFCSFLHSVSPELGAWRHFSLCFSSFAWWSFWSHVTCLSQIDFLQFKECLFFDLFTHFHDFWSQIGVVILVTPKQEMERKSEWFCGVKFFCSSFEVVRKRCLNKNSSSR